MKRNLKEFSPATSPKTNFNDFYLPVNLVHWEDDVIIDSEEARTKVIFLIFIDFLFIIINRFFF